jgi:hypothetical protein
MLQRCVGQNQGELVATITGQHFVLSEDCLGSAAKLCEGFITGKMAVNVIDGFELIDVEHHNAQRMACSNGTINLTIENVEQVAFIVRLCEAVGGHDAIDSIVILGLDLVCRKELEDLIAEPYAVSGGQPAAFDALFVNVGAVGTAKVCDSIIIFESLDGGVLSRDGIVFQTNIAPQLSTNELPAFANFKYVAHAFGRINSHQARSAMLGCGRQQHRVQTV